MPKTAGDALAWEIDWTRRRRIHRHAQPEVWARNLLSAFAHCRTWHWTKYQTIIAAGIRWVHKKQNTGRSISTSGYVIRARSSLSAQEIAIADANSLWIGASRGRRHGVKEHQLVACIKYGGLRSGFLVRHLNGDKTDNRAENLLLGTHRDNHLDHRSATLEMIYWRERALRAEGCEPRDLAETLLMVKQLLAQQ